MAKKAYRVRNWSKYNKALIQRGSLTLWINEDVLKSWYEPDRKDKSKGRPRIYSEKAVEACAVIRQVLHLGYRQTHGFVLSLFQLLKLKIAVPSYSQLYRRQRKLDKKLRHQVKGPIHVVVDATGLKIFGEGEWKVRQHGYTKHRMWRKLHVGVDVATKEIVMMELTDNHIGESKLLVPLLDQYAELTKVGADKGYDSFDCHEEVGRRGAISAIAIQRKSKIRQSFSVRTPPLVRDEIVRRIQKVGTKRWKKEVSYHSRSLVENSFCRFKTLFGSKLRSTLLENQKIEALICCNILNAFTQLGMPDSYCIEK